MKLTTLFAFLLIASCGNPTRHEYSDHTLRDSLRSRTIEYRIWSPKGLGEGSRPLVIVSHGSGGEFNDHQWLINTLLDEGYIVSALNHPFNTTRDNTPEGIVSVWDRPADVSLVLTDILENTDKGQQIDAMRIGVAGFSSGGYTAIALAGAIFEPNLMETYCAGSDHGPDCALGESVAYVDYAGATQSYRDARFRSVFAMAPAVGSGITVQSLNAIEVPVFITASRDDELVYPKFSAERYAEHIPNSTMSLIPSGGHFVFLECNAMTWIADQFITEFDLCGSEFSVDQDKIRAAIGEQAVAFFANSLDKPTKS